MPRIAVVTGDQVGDVASLAALRACHFARELAREFEVTLLTPNEVRGVDLAGLDVRLAPSFTPAALDPVLDQYDVVIAHRLPFPTMRRLARRKTHVIYDLYVPFITEHLGMLEADDRSRAEHLFSRWALVAERFALATANAIICSTERQRDFWLGMLAALGRIDLDLYRRDHSLRNLVEVVPVGVPAEPPVHERPVLKGVVPGIGEDDRVLLWAGGIWNWLDPLTVIRAVEQLARRRSDVKLFFLGSQQPGVSPPAMAQRARMLAGQLGLLDRVVFFNESWVAYAERASYLLEADLGVSAHFDTVETRYAFRTRLLDHFWAGLPTVTTRGDELGELVERRGLGRVVEYEDVEGYATAIEELLGDEGERARIGANLESMRAELAWPRAVEPLVRLVGSEGKPVKPLKTTSMRLDELLLRLRVSLALGGPSGLARRQARKLGRTLRSPARP